MAWRLAQARATTVHADSTVVWLKCRYKETVHFKDIYRHEQVAPAAGQNTLVIAINIENQQVAQWDPLLGRLSDWEKVRVTETKVEWDKRVIASRAESTMVIIDRASLRYMRRFMSEPGLNSRDDVVLIEWAGSCQKTGQPRRVDKRQF